MKNYLPALLLALILAIPSATATWSASLNAPETMVEDGHVDGDLVALRYNLTQLFSSLGSWTLTGSELAVYTHNNESNVTVGSPISKDPPYETSARHGEFVATPYAYRERATFAVTSQGSSPHLEHTGTSTTLLPGKEEPFRSSGEFSHPSRHHTTVAVEDTAQVMQRVNAGIITITGSFVLTIWEMDWRVTDENGKHEYKSGLEQEPVVSAPPEIANAHVGKTHYRETFFYVKDGTLTLKAVPGGKSEYFLRDWNLNAPSGIELKNVGGTLIGGALEQTLLNSTLYLPGPAKLGNGTLNSRGLVFDAYTPSDVIYVDGSALEVVPRTPGKSPPEKATAVVMQLGSEWWFGPSFGVFLLGSFLVGVRSVKPYWLLRWKMRRGNHDFVAENAPRFFSKQRTRKSVLMMHALALLGAGRFQEAVEFVFTLMPDDRPDAATWNYMAAMALAGSGEFDEAYDHLNRCLTIAPQYIEEVKQNPLLVRLLNDHPRRLGDGGASYA